MFDPYHKWFGIAPKDQPPNHYRLLAIDRFESDPEVIDAAANRQMAYLQQRATGEHADLSQKLLNEIAAARLCLLNPKQKAEYDAGLRKTTAQSTPTDEELDALQTGVDLSGILDAPAQTSVAVPKRRPPSTFRFSALKPWHYAAAIGGVVVLLLTCWAIFSSGRDAKRVAQADPVSSDLPKKTSHIAPPAVGPANTAKVPPSETAASKPSSPQNSVPLASADVMDRGTTSNTNDAIYTVDIEPPMAELSVRKFGGVEVTGEGFHRKIVFESPNGRSEVVEVACEGYRTKSTSVTPRPGGREHLAITLEKSEQPGSTETSEKPGSIDSDVQSNTPRAPWDATGTSSANPEPNPAASNSPKRTTDAREGRAPKKKGATADDLPNFLVGKWEANWPNGLRVVEMRRNGRVSATFFSSGKTVVGSWRLEGRRLHFNLPSIDGVTPPNNDWCEIVAAEKDFVTILMSGKNRQTLKRIR